MFFKLADGKSRTTNNIASITYRRVATSDKFHLTLSPILKFTTSAPIARADGDKLKRSIVPDHRIDLVVTAGELASLMARCNNAFPFVAKRAR